MTYPPDDTPPEVWTHLEDEADRLDLHGSPEPSCSAGLDLKEAAFTNLWARWMKYSNGDPETHKRENICRDSFMVGWDECEAHYKQND